MYSFFAYKLQINILNLLIRSDTLSSFAGMISMNYSALWGALLFSSGFLSFFILLRLKNLVRNGPNHNKIKAKKTSRDVCRFRE